MRDEPSERPAIERPAPRHPIRSRLALAAMLGVSATALAACSSADPGLIPATNAGPLQVDFETVAQDAQNGNGSCAETATAIRKTEQDFSELPPSVASNLRSTLSSGIANLSNRALTLCSKVTQSTTTTTTTTSAASTTTFTAVETTTTETTALSVPTTSSPGGGTPAPGAGEATPPAAEAPAGAGGAGVQEGIK